MIKRLQPYWVKSIARSHFRSSRHFRSRYTPSQLSIRAFTAKPKKKPKRESKTEFEEPIHVKKVKSEPKTEPDPDEEPIAVPILNNSFYVKDF